MKFSINKTLSAATIMVVLVAGLVLFISIRQARQVSDTAKSISYTEQVLTHIHNHLLAVLRNETAFRGYLITGKGQFLESVKQSETDITNELALLKTLATDNPVQQALLDSLSVYSDKRIAFSNQAVALSKDKGIESASALVSTSEGKFYTDKVYHIGMTMQQEENQLLEKRKKNNKLTISRLNMILYSILAAGFILSIIIIQSARSRIRKEKLNEQKFSALLDAAPDATVIVNEKGTIEMVNHQIQNLFGYTPTELIGQPVEILIPGELRSRHIHHRDGFIKKAGVRSMGAGIELKAIRKDGVSFPVEISLSPIKTVEGLLISASIRDITMRKKAEERLRKTEKDFQLLVSSVKDYAIFLIDKNGLVVSWNKGAENIKGYTAAEIIGQPMNVFYTMEEIQEGVPQNNLLMALRHGHYETEGWRLRKDGSSFYANVALTSLIDDEGNPYGYAKVTRDITEQKKAEAALSKLNSELEQRVKDRTEEILRNEKLYRNLFENLLHGFAYCKVIFEQDQLKDYIFLAVNSEYESLTGLKDLTGKRISEVMPGLLDSDPKYAEIVSRVALSGNPEKFETYVEGLNRWFSISLYSPAKEYFVSLIENITERKKAEEDLRQSERRLKEAQAITHISNWEVDLVQNIHTWSDEFYRIYGLNKDEAQPSVELFMSFMHPDDAGVAQKKVDIVFNSFHDSTFEFRFIRKDGAIRHACTEWRFEFDEKGKPIRLFGTLQDITTSKEAEEELRRSIELFQYATQASLDVIWELNFETRQFLVHKGKERPFGENSLIDRELGLDGRYIVEEDKEIVGQSFLEAGMDTACERWVLEYRVHSGNNSILHIINHAMFIRDKKGKAVRVIGAITDITERKKLELELLDQQRNEQLKMIATTLEAQEKERNAIGIELHDNVNQILVATKLFLSMVNGDPTKNHAIISSCMENLQNAIDENRKIAHVLVAPDFEEAILAGQISILTDNMLKITGIETHVYSANLREELLNDQQKLVAYRIAQEQCTNIIKYAKARTVNVSLSTANGLFKMTISDDGAGMEKGKKTDGIGLRNMRSRLSIFNGSATVNSAQGKGFELEISIPLTGK